MLLLLVYVIKYVKGRWYTSQQPAEAENKKKDDGESERA